MNYAEMKTLAKKFGMWHVEGTGQYWIDPFEIEQTTEDGKQAQDILVKEVLLTREARLADIIERMDSYEFPRAARAFIFFFDKCIEHGYHPETKLKSLIPELEEIGRLRRIPAGRLLKLYKLYNEI